MVNNFSNIIQSFKEMPLWQKSLTVIGVATVGVTITVITTKGIKYSWSKYQEHKQKKELGNKLDELQDIAKESEDPEFEKLVNNLANNKLIQQLAGKSDAKVIDIKKVA